MTKADEEAYTPDHSTVEKTLLDRLGAYHLELNGCRSHEPFMLLDHPDEDFIPDERCDTHVKNEFVKSVMFSINKIIATERKKAVQQFAAEVKGKAETYYVDLDDIEGKLTVVKAISMAAIDEVLKSYEP